MPETEKLALPVEIEGITRNWLSAALGRYAPGVRVRDFAIADMIRGTCTKIRLRLDLENNRRDAPIPETVFLKGGFEPHSRAMGTMHQYGVFLTLGYCIFIVNEAVFQPEAIDTACTARFSQAMLDHDTIGKLERIALS